MSSAGRIINIELLLEQTGNSQDFIKEIFADFFTEIQEAHFDIKQGLMNKNIDQIDKAIHRIKGSCSYLGCEKMRAHLVEIDEYIREKKSYTILQSSCPSTFDFVIQHLTNMIYIVFEVDLVEIKQELSKEFP